MTIALAALSMIAGFLLGVVLQWLLREKKADD